MTNRVLGRVAGAGIDELTRPQSGSGTRVTTSFRQTSMPQVRCDVIESMVSECTVNIAALAVGPGHGHDWGMRPSQWGSNLA